MNEDKSTSTSFSPSSKVPSSIETPSTKISHSISSSKLSSTLNVKVLLDLIIPSGAGSISSTSGAVSSILASPNSTEDSPALLFASKPKFKVSPSWQLDKSIIPEYVSFSFVKVTDCVIPESSQLSCMKTTSSIPDSSSIASILTVCSSLPPNKISPSSGFSFDISGGVGSFRIVKINSC